MLRKHREQASLSQEALAHASDVHRTYVSLIERGIRHPTLDVVFRLAEALKIAPSVLVAATEKQVTR
ncbi:MAG: helix-turn-helix transcriptional regulator [Pseudomonadales bacterium]